MKTPAGVESELTIRARHQARRMCLGIGSVQGHIGCMETFDKCMSVLRPLISEGDTNGIGAAERAVNEYVAATPESERQTGW